MCWFRATSSIDSVDSLHTFYLAVVRECVRGDGSGIRSGNTVLTKSQSLCTEAQSHIPRLFDCSLAGGGGGSGLKSTNLHFQRTVMEAIRSITM